MTTKLLRKSMVLGLVITLNAMVLNAQDNPTLKKGFVKIFNSKNWDGWHLKLRNGDAEMAKEVYAIERKKIHVFKNMSDSLNLNTGENATHGLFYTNKKYSKYILTHMLFVP